jgi:uncharacterized membrane protein YfcA
VRTRERGAHLKVLPVASHMAIFASSLIIGIAFLGEAIFGFAGGMISVPLLSLLLGVKDAVTVVLVFQLLMGLLLITARNAVNRYAATSAGLAVISGTILGTLLLDFVPANLLKLFLLVVIVAYLVKTLLFSRYKLFSSYQGASLVGGIAGGFLQGVVGMGGPPLLIFLNELGLNKQAFRATIICLLFLSNIVRLPLSLFSGLLNQTVAIVVINGLPGFVLALIVGHRYHGLLSEKLYKAAVYGVLGVSAISIAIQFIR